jgi:type I restriction-modification system DNA methylase subunit
MSIYDYDNDFAHYELDEKTKKEFGQFWTPYPLIEKMMDKAGTIEDKSSIWYDETKTNLDPTMGAGNIIIAMLLIFIYK